MVNASLNAREVNRIDHDKRRTNTYPEPIANTWYQLCDSSEVTIEKVIEVRALGQTFAVWRTADGTPVCQGKHTAQRKL